jgi:hypothetical protein
MIIGTGQIIQNQSETQIRVKLYEKYAQLNEIDNKELKKAQESNQVKDYIETSTLDGKYDKNDYERVLDKFKSMDSQVKAHEQLHASLANTTTPIQYNYQMGPDGKMYATGGSVRLDTSMPNDPEAAANKLDQIKKSASSAGSDMSSADATIAIQANLMKARLELNNN